VGIAKNEGKGISAFPVPASELVRFSFGSSNASPPILLTILDIQGRLVRSYTLDGTSKEFQLPVSDFRNGIYQAIFSNRNGDVESKRLIVQHL
jgi:hypothetical protein